MQTVWLTDAQQDDDKSKEGGGDTGLTRGEPAGSVVSESSTALGWMCSAEEVLPQVSNSSSHRDVTSAAGCGG